MLLPSLAVRDTMRDKGNTQCNMITSFTWKSTHPGRIRQTIAASWVIMQLGAADKKPLQCFFLFVWVITPLQKHMADVHSPFVFIARRPKTLQPAGKQIKKEFFDKDGLEGRRASLLWGIMLGSNKTLIKHSAEGESGTGEEQYGR